MARIVPSVSLVNPGTIVASGTYWNSGPKAMGDFYVSPPTFRGRQTSSISTTSGTWFPMPLQTADFDSDSGHSNTVNNTRYTCQVAGWYWVEGYAAWTNATSANARMDAAIYKNGSVVFGSQQGIPKQVNDFGSVCASVFVQLAVGDYIELYGRQNGGTTISTTNGTDLANCLNATWIHA